MSYPIFGFLFFLTNFPVCIQTYGREWVLIIHSENRHTSVTYMSGWLNLSAQAFIALITQED